MTGLQAGSSHGKSRPTIRFDVCWGPPQDVLKIVGGDAGAREACQHVGTGHICVSTHL